VEQLKLQPLEYMILPNLAVPVSGTGSLLKAMINNMMTIRLVVSDRECPGVEIARAAGIKTVVMPRSFKSDFTPEKRNEYTLNAIELFKANDINFIAMAGFMTVWSPVLFEHFRNRITNIHPALLPAFKGDHAVRDALAAGVKITGTTVHYATEKLDDGEILAQEPVRVLPGDTKDSLHERIKVVERRLYPQVISELLANLSIAGAKPGIQTLTEAIEPYQVGAPTCTNCGHKTVRNAACWKCLNCGESVGCT
jgi:phosphoribosylglycinamide formyltransferase-1